jgi:hypothetical protein
MKNLLKNQMDQKIVLRENEIKERHMFENKMQDENKVRQDEIKQKRKDEKKRAVIHWQEEL